MVNIDTHRLLIILLFNNKEEIESKIKFNEISYDDLIRLASSHLMIPALYVNLRENDLLKKINDDLKKYLKSIYDLNKIRNNNLMNEIKELSKLFIENKIDHVFLKGSSYIASERYIDDGKRMIGDIDILVSKSHYDKAVKITKKYGYYADDKFVFDTKHYPRMVHPKKIFALE